MVDCLGALETDAALGKVMDLIREMQVQHETSTAKLKYVQHRCIHAQRLFSALQEHYEATEKALGMLQTRQGKLAEPMLSLEAQIQGIMDGGTTTTFLKPQALTEEARQDADDLSKPKTPSETSCHSPVDLTLVNPQTSSKRRTSRVGSLLEEALTEDVHEVIQEHSSIPDMARAVVRHRAFEVSIAICICANAIVMGLEAELSLYEDMKRAVWPDVMDAFFLSVFSLEILCRLLAFGRKCWTDAWFLFDFSLVMISMVAVIVATALDHVGDDNKQLADTLTNLLVIRSMRLLRIASTFRLMHFFETVWRLVNGLLTSYSAMLSTCCLLALTLYVFACIGIEIITKDARLAAHPDTAFIVAYNFGSIFRTMLTLMQFVTVDSMAAVYMPLIILKPGLFLYFLGLVLIVSISLMNLVTAILVESALARAAGDKDHLKNVMKQKIRLALPALETAFDDLDTDNSGFLTREEVEHVPLEMLPAAVISESGINSMAELFDLLDVDDTNSLDRTEFLEGLISIFLQDVLES
ncbi:unnamed protein product [Polarella glacialis]|uniref:EF-hand domain-containing protein n=1 Tax=Polarella glacialis TaxID=89957 RepID=A0A813EM04_POLGL|nr:unnamed protein product [Polarella glacialis]